MMAKFFIILSALLALISNSMSIRTIGPLRVAPSSPISKECRLFSEEIVDCTPFFFSNEQSQPDELCCSAFEYAASMDPECICDMIGNHNSSLSPNKIPTLSRVTLPCDIKINSPASSPEANVVLSTTNYPLHVWFGKYFRQHQDDKDIFADKA
ncbi:hypothetical protein JHK87_035632 [Glycine soja]|nr:hypothetical protein JHK87_035632 [Glycine soja]